MVPCFLTERECGGTGKSTSGEDHLETVSTVLETVLC